MNKYFTVLQDGALKRILIKEQDHEEILAIKSLEQLKSEFPFDSYNNRKVYKLFTHSWDHFADGYAWNWKCIESEFEDNSSLDNRYAVFETKGNAIKRMLGDGFKVFIDGKEFEG